MRDLGKDVLKGSVYDMTASVIEMTDHPNLRGKPKVSTGNLYLNLRFIICTQRQSNCCQFYDT